MLVVQAFRDLTGTRPAEVIVETVVLLQKENDVPQIAHRKNRTAVHQDFSNGARVDRARSDVRSFPRIPTQRAGVVGNASALGPVSDQAIQRSPNRHGPSKHGPVTTCAGGVGGVLQGMLAKSKNSVRSG